MLLYHCKTLPLLVHCINQSWSFHSWINTLTLSVDITFQNIRELQKKMYFIFTKAIFSNYPVHGFMTWALLVEPRHQDLKCIFTSGTLGTTFIRLIELACEQVIRDAPSSESPRELYHWPVNNTGEFSPNSTFPSKSPLWKKPFAVSLYLTFGECPRYSYFYQIRVLATLIGPLCYLVRIFADFLANFCHFDSFRQIRHFRQNRHSQRGPMIVLFEFLQRLWRTSAIFVKIETFLGAPLLSYLTCS